MMFVGLKSDCEFHFIWYSIFDMFDCLDQVSISEEVFEMKFKPREFK